MRKWGFRFEGNVLVYPDSTVTNKQSSHSAAKYQEIGSYSTVSVTVMMLTYPSRSVISGK